MVEPLGRSRGSDGPIGRAKRQWCDPRICVLARPVRAALALDRPTLALNADLVRMEGVGIVRLSIMLVAVGGIAGVVAACDGPDKEATDTEVSSMLNSGSASVTDESSEADSSPTTSGRDCTLPPEWQQSPFVDVTGGPDQPDPDLLRAMSSAGGGVVSSDDYRVAVARLISDDASTPLPPVEEDGMASDEWWSTVDHDVYAQLQERLLGEAGVDYCVWYLQSQDDYDTTRTEIKVRLDQD